MQDLNKVKQEEVDGLVLKQDKIKKIYEDEKEMILRYKTDLEK